MFRGNLIFCIFCLVAAASGKLDESVIRTASAVYSGADSIIRQYSDGKTTVVAIFTSEEELLECHVAASNINVTQKLFNQAVLNPLNEKQYLFQADVQRIGRKCRKFTRDVNRIPIRDLTDAQWRTRKRLALDTLPTGSSYCTRQLVPVKDDKPDVHQKGEGNSYKARVENCCKEWQRCGPIVKGLSTVNGLYNPFFWPLRSCDCERKLRHCTTGAIAKKAADDKISGFVHSGFSEPKCFSVKHENVCVEYDFWHVHCQKTETRDIYVIQNLEHAWNEKLRLLIGAVEVIERELLKLN